TENLRVLRAGEGVRLDRSYDRPCNVLVQIRAANAACRHANDHLVGTRLGWFGHLLDSEISCLVKAKRAHTHRPVVGRRAGFSVARSVMERSAPPAVARTDPGTRTPYRERRGSRVADCGPCR